LVSGRRVFNLYILEKRRGRPDIHGVFRFVQWRPQYLYCSCDPWQSRLAFVSHQRPVTSAPALGVVQSTACVVAWGLYWVRYVWLL